MDDNKEPRVLVGCVTYDKDEAYITDFLSAIRSQDYRNFDIVFVDTSANDEYSARLRGTGCIVLKGEPDLDHPIKRITSGRNLVRDYATINGYDYVWFVDNDTLPPKDALSRLLSHGKDINAGICLMNMNVDGSSKVMPNVYRFDEGKKSIEPIPIGGVQDGSLMEVSAAGFGCVLLSSKVLSGIKLRYFEDSMAGEDMAFFQDAKEGGFSAFADTGVKCTHLVFPPGDPRNKKFMFDSYEKIE